jgi:hypothetical protein
MRRTTISAALGIAVLAAFTPAVISTAPAPHACRTRVLATGLDNPMSPRVVNGSLVFSQSGSGRVSRLRRLGGRPQTLISGFGFDSFAGYRISALGIAVDPTSGAWIVAAAEGPGRVYRFNPFSVLALPRVVIVSGGTKAVYAGTIDEGDPPLRTILEVGSGVIGMTVDVRQNRVLAALFGRGPRQGRVVSWEAASNRPRLRTVLARLTNPVDVAFTKDGKLLVLEFGRPGAGGGRLSEATLGRDGRVAIVRWLMQDMANPSGVTVAEDGTVYITELGMPRNGRHGRILALRGCGSR